MAKKHHAHHSGHQGSSPIETPHNMGPNFGDIIGGAHTRLHENGNMKGYFNGNIGAANMIAHPDLEDVAGSRKRKR